MRRSAAGAVATERILLDACSSAVEECLGRLSTRDTGLTEEEVEERRRQSGRNEVSVKKTGICGRM